MISCYLQGVGIIAPGIANWSDGVAVLTGTKPFTPIKPTEIKTDLIPPTEKRRASATALLAVAVAEEATKQAQIDPTELSNVFASFTSDPQVIHRLCNGLAMQDPVVSPFQFHNSVHNAPAGYWSIATHCHQQSSSISCGSSSFVAGLLATSSIISIENQDVLFVCYDIPAPEPLHEKFPQDHSCGVALVLTQQKTHTSLAKFDIELNPVNSSTVVESHIVDTDLQSLVTETDSLKSLEILTIVAHKQCASITLPYLDTNGVKVTIEPCN